MHHSDPASAIVDRVPVRDATGADLPPDRLARGLRLERIDSARNMARYYTLAVEVTLFEDWSCTRRFGRIGARGGRIMLGLFETRAAAEAELVAILRRKQARGYRVANP